MTWRPMSEAPRDGTRVLLRAHVPKPHNLHERVRAVVASWDGYCWDEGFYTVDPTHWQPLPSTDTDLSAPSPIVEARIEGMREGADIALTAAAVGYADAEYARERLDAAIAVLREGGGR